MSYCTIYDLRFEGITEEDKTDEELERLIELSCDFIDRVTGQFFEPREQTIRLDGRGGQILVLPLFLQEAEYVKISSEVISDFVLYNRMEDRKYPKIFRSARWPKGILNVEIKGTFGYVEEDKSTPSDIKRAAMKLALYHFPALSDLEAQNEKNLQGLLVSETTDGHSYSLSGEAVSKLYASSITGDTEIDTILKKYSRSNFRITAI